MSALLAFWIIVAPLAWLLFDSFGTSKGTTAMRSAPALSDRATVGATTHATPVRSTGSL